MTTITATRARQGWFDLLKKSVKGHMPIKIKSKTGDAVLMSEDDYESLVETLEILSVPGMAKSVRRAKQDIRSGKTKSLKEVFGR